MKQSFQGVEEERRVPMVQSSRHFESVKARKPLQKRRLQALARPEFQMLVEASPDALVLIDEQGSIVLVNHQTERLFGYQREELLGQPLESLLPERLRTLHLQHRQRYFEHPVTRPMGIGLELSGQRKDGSEFPVDISLSPLRTQAGLFIISSIRDISERRHLEQLARARQELLQAVLDALPTGVYLAQGEQARLLFANRAAVDMWGARWQPGQPLTEFLSTHHIRMLASDGHELASDELAAVRTLRTQEPVLQYQEVIQHADGSALPVLFNAVLLPTALFEHLEKAEKGAGGVLVVMQDISPLKATEHLKDEFIGMAAHELRNPLSALKGFVEMLLIQSQRGHGAQLADWQQEAIEEINLATSRLVDLTEALLDVTRIQAGRLVLSLASHDLVVLIRQVVRRVQESSRQHHLSFQTEVESLVVSVDALRIEQVLSNLLFNAVKYSPDGGEIVLRLQVEQEQGQVVLAVQDRGIGIPAEQQACLFQSFARATNVQGIMGAGLGLYLCRELVERHGGHIWLESVEGQGSTFFITLPIISERGMASRKYIERCT
jgi:PAS domain S-box-containing protein